MPRRLYLATFVVLFSAVSASSAVAPAQEPEAAKEAAKPWKKHVVHTGFATATAVAADFSGDGKLDVISNSGGKTRLFVAPDWREIVLDDTPGHNCIHSEVMDVDGDGDPDWIGARYSPGLVFWLERPERPTQDRWRFHLVDDRVNGVHGLLVGNVDRDDKPDLLANRRSRLAIFPTRWFGTPCRSHRETPSVSTATCSLKATRRG